jgi:hypothetical protein
MRQAFSNSSVVIARLVRATQFCREKENWVARMKRAMTDLGKVFVLETASP